MISGGRAWTLNRVADPRQSTSTQYRRFLSDETGEWEDQELEHSSATRDSLAYIPYYSFSQVGARILREQSKDSSSPGAENSGEDFQEAGHLIEHSARHADEDEADPQLENSFPFLRLDPSRMAPHCNTEFRFHAHEARLLLCCEDHKELHFVLPFMKSGQYHASFRQFTFVAFRRIQFGTQVKTISWCCGEGCLECNKLTAELYSGADFSDCRAEDMTSLLPDNGGMCPVAAKVLVHLGGEAQLRHLMDMSTPNTTSTVEVSHTIHGLQYIIVNPTAPSFESWGAIKLFDRMTRQSLVCQTCTASNVPCNHVKVVTSEVCHQHAQLSAEDFESIFSKKFDYESGTLRCRCITSGQLPLPGRPLEEWDEGRLHAILSSQSSGGKAPFQCYPQGHDLPCSECGHQMWVYSDPSESKVWGRTTVYDIEIYGCSCEACGHELSVDGPEYGLLRQDRKNSFELSLLYFWMELLSTDRAPKWFTFWRDTVLGYHLPIGSSEEDKALLWRAGRDAFVQATFDFVSLMQGIERAMIEAFTCTCCECDELSGDGLVMGNRRDECHVVHPWAKPNDDQLPIAGSLHHERVFIPGAELQKFVLRHVGAVDPPLSAYEHRAMISALTKDCPSLVPFVDKENVRHTSKIKRLIANLAYASPVSKIIPIQTWDTIQALVRGATITNHIVSVKLSPYTPLLAMSLASPKQLALLGKPCSADVCALLSAMLEKAKAAYQIASFQQVADLRNKSIPESIDQIDQSSSLGGASQSVRHPSEWASWDEFYFRTGVWGGWDIKEDEATGTFPYTPSELGGTHVHRRVRLYAADKKSFGMSRAAQMCTKHKPPASKLIPGFIFFWCLHCGICKRFALMPQAESPKLVFQLLFSLWARPPRVFSYDNNCTEETYILNREPWYFRFTKFLIDAFHFAGHVHCCENYNTALYDWVRNASISEQKNAFLSHLKEHAPFMNQFTLLWYLRLFLFMRNRAAIKRFWQMKAGKRSHDE